MCHRCWVNRIQLQQVLLNLVMNAIEAMADIEERGSSRSDRRPRGRGGPGALVAVHDTGAGVAPENLDRLFDAFYKNNETRRLGLGLSISRTIIEGHGAGCGRPPMPARERPSSRPPRLGQETV